MELLQRAKLLALSILVLGVPQVVAQTADDVFDGNILHEICLFINPSDWQNLKTNFLDNTYYPCEFEWRYQGGNILAQDVRIRSRGTGSRSSVKPGLRVDFDRSNSQQTLLGLRSLILRNNTQDASMLHERLSMLFFQRMGFPAPREVHTRLFVNNQYVGLYTIVESVDRSFLRRNFGEDNGHLYKYDYEPEDPPYYFEYRGPDPSRYSPKPFNPEVTHEKDPDPRPIEAMVRKINESSDAEFESAMAEYLDLKLFVAQVAIENFLADVDGVVGDWGMNNYYLYRLEGKNLSRLIPWDKSHAFFKAPEHDIWHNVIGVPPERQNRLMQRAINVPQVRNLYLETLIKSADAAGGPGGWLEQEIEREYNQVRTAALEDPNKQCLGSGGSPRPCSNQEFEAEVNFLREFARHRRDSVLTQVAASAGPSSQRLFAVPDRGGVSLVTAGGSGSTVTGYARIQPDPGGTTPSGVAIFGLRQNNVLVTEAGVPASPLIQAGRVYAEVQGAVSTGLAIANPNSQPATVSFFFTDVEGKNFGQGGTTIPANGQIAKFLNQDPFNGGSPLNGTFTFNSSLPVSVIALRGLNNERNEFLITTLPVSDLTAAPGGTILIPHFADGGGWTTQVVLVNPSDEPINGTVQFFGQGSATAPAQPVTVTIDGRTDTTFSYTIPPRSSHRLQTSGSGSDIQAGSVRVLPAPEKTSPSVLIVFSFKNNAGITVTEAGVPALKTGSAFRMYSELSGDFNSAQAGTIQTGVALANPSTGETTVKFELTTLSGAAVGTETAVIPANGQMALFLNQIKGFESLPVPFQGVLRLSTTSSAGIAVVGLRGRNNERGDFLITTTPPVDENSAPSTTELFFPHLVEAGGYTTQFILFSGVAAQSSSGMLRFFSQSGQPLNLVLR